MTTSASTAPVASTPATVETSGAESRFLLHCLDWQGYEKLLKLFGDDGPRVSFLDGVVELMSPGPLHEGYSELLNRMIGDLIVELDLPARSLGSTTFQRRGRNGGLEPDKCFYLASVGLLRGQDLAKLKPMPPPDLAIEVEVSSPLLDKLAIYAGLGVPEIWRYNQDGLTILCLRLDGQYHVSERSQVFPWLPIEAFRAQLASYDFDQETAWFRAYRVWVREVVAPLYQAGK